VITLPEKSPCRRWGVEILMPLLLTAWLWVPAAADAGDADNVVIYVVRRGWHIDVGFAASDLRPPLSALAPEFPGLKYLVFGFGDEQYLEAKNHNAPVMLAALWPGRGLVLATGLTASPQDAFGVSQVIELTVTERQSLDAQAFVWRSLAQPESHSNGPYEGSVYFAATPKYSAVHTCNTWAAESLAAAALPIHSGGVIFAGQLWSQLRRLERKQSAIVQPMAAAGSTPRHGTAQQGGLVPSWQTTVVPEF
jgi:Protein of unknown function (DUF2459)